MHFSNKKTRRTPSVIIVSLIDVLLVVLIFLMVSTTFRKKASPQLKLALPASQAATPGSTRDKPFVVTITTNFPYLFVGERPVTLDRLQNELNDAAQADPQVNVAIRADKAAPVGELMKVIDAAKIANVGSINAYTERAN